MCDYLYGSADPTKLTRDGNFRGIVESFSDRDTLIGYYDKVCLEIADSMSSDFDVQVLMTMESQLSLVEALKIRNLMKIDPNLSSKMAINLNRVIENYGLNMLQAKEVLKIEDFMRFKNISVSTDTDIQLYFMSLYYDMDLTNILNEFVRIMKSGSKYNLTSSDAFSIYQLFIDEKVDISDSVLEKILSISSNSSVLGVSDVAQAYVVSGMNEDLIKKAVSLIEKDRSLSLVDALKIVSAEGYNINSTSSIVPNDFILAMKVYDGRDNTGSALKSLANYIVSGDINQLTKNSALRGMVQSLDIDTIVKYYSSIYSVYRNSGTYDNNVKTNSAANNVDLSFSSVKNRILSHLPQGVDELTKIRYLYLELCKNVSYDMSYFAADNAHDIDAKNEILNKVAGFSNKVTCWQWSDQFYDLVVSSGVVDPAKVSIMQAGKGHKWVEINFDDYIIRADATEPFNHTVDISSVKSGFQTYGFIAISPSNSGLKLNGKWLDGEMKRGMNFEWLRSIDNSLGYTSDQGSYFNEQVAKIKKRFGKTSLASIFGGKSSANIVSANLNYMLESPIPNNMNSYDAFARFLQLRYALFSDTNNDALKRAKSNIHVYKCAIKISPTHYEGIAIVEIDNDDLTVTCRIIGDNGYDEVLTFNNLHDKENYLKMRGMIYLK